MFRVEVVSPLTENTVLSIQQLFSNLMSAVCIIAFNSLKKKSTPEFTHSFYLLILIHLLASLYFASFKDKCLSRKEDAHRKKKKQTREGSKLPRPRINKERPRPALEEWKQKYPFLLPTPGTTASLLVSDVWCAKIYIYQCLTKFVAPSKCISMLYLLIVNKCSS